MAYGHIIAQNQETIGDVESGSSVILSGVAGIHGNWPTAGVSLGVVIGVEAENAELFHAGVNCGDDLILAIDSTRLILVDVLAGGSQRSGRIDICRTVEVWRADVVAEVIVNAAAVQIGDVAGDAFGNLTINANRTLHVQGGVKIRIEGPIGRGRRGSRRIRRLHRIAGLVSV